jgi:hypothetical protein
LDPAAVLLQNLYILENTSHLRGEMSADVIWGKKYEKWKRKRGNLKEKIKKKERGKKKRKGK